MHRVLAAAGLALLAAHARAGDDAIWGSWYATDADAGQAQGATRQEGTMKQFFSSMVLAAFLVGPVQAVNIIGADDLPRNSYYAALTGGAGGTDAKSYAGASSNFFGDQNSAVTLIITNPHGPTDAQASGQVSSNGLGSPPTSSATGIEALFFAVSGPNSNQLVPVRIIASGGVRNDGSGSRDVSTASFFLYALASYPSSLSVTQLDEAEACYGVCPRGSFSSYLFDRTFNLHPNDVYEVYLSAFILLDESFGNAGVFTADALADPSIFIDPNFASIHPEYSIVFSEDASPVSSVPEPPTLALLVLGLAASLARRRRIA